MLKILSLTYKSSEAGGPHQVSTDYKNAMDNNFFDIKNMSLTNNLLFQYIFNKKKIKQYINTFNLIHIHNFFSLKTIIVLKIGESLSIPSIITLHGNLNKWSMKKSFFRKIIFLKLFNRIIHSVYLIHFLNNEEKIEASKFININKVNTITLKNCIDISKYKTTRKKDFIFRILFFGRLDKKKNFLKVVDIANIFKINNINDVKFLFVGPKTKKNLYKLKNKIKILQLENFIEVRDLVNSIEQKNDLFDEIDIFILPSEDEGDSIAIKESLASGKPVVISKECKVITDEASKEFIKVVSDKSVVSYYNEIIKLYSNREELRFLVHKIQSYAQKNFSINMIKEKLPSIYLNCVGHSFKTKDFDI